MWPMLDNDTSATVAVLEEAWAQSYSYETE